MESLQLRVLDDQADPHFVQSAFELDEVEENEEVTEDAAETN